jgi:nucleoside-diphosphate-sugar epimerase
MDDGERTGNIIITGASGFLGRNLIGSLLRDGNSGNGSLFPMRLIGFSSSSEKLRERFPVDLAEFYDREKIDSEELRSIWRNAIVVNCAFPRNNSGTEMAEGLSYIKRVFEAAAGNGAAAVINISSQSVYAADRPESAGEDTPLCLETCYAVGKYAVELMLESICTNTETAFTSVRMASLIGPDFDPRIVNRFVKQALQDGVVTVKRNRQRFGFFDIEDAVTALSAMLISDPSKWQKVYNLGGRGTYTLIEMAEAVEKACSAAKKVVIKITEGDEYANSGLRADLFYRDFGFDPVVTLDQSVEKIVQAYSRN